ncbi:hypothetical protein ASE95_09380 [Sphingomonas sp. Leaf231]|uniref:DUF4349 domain-containing protein n=1 Tax=Sphingomonas sp. Leaf231 TaxID=1736301 RepID=UPI0006FF16EE|nr:DUF4349 domain-containing protein [Sphingomonas sp. Leaf231]KQN92840.1 hypothetical protein ASE95_09380 [Sphingomonas sp. Leaf231]
MMIRRMILGVALLLAACGSAQNSGKLNTFDVEKPTADADADSPRIAYSYALAYRLDPGTLDAVHRDHLGLCRKLTRQRCIVMEDAVTRNPRGDDAGTMRLLVDARLAGTFGQRLDTRVSQAGGALQSRRVTAEDVTRQVIDVDARLRAKQALSDRLLRLVQNGGGSVGDLVAAEKAYAEVQQELDAARSLRTELQRRVAMSEVTITYAVTPSGGVWAPIRLAFRDGGDSFAVSAAAAITFVIAATPWLVIVGPAIWLLVLGWRRFRRWRASRSRA